MRYRWILFDADGTLFDYDRAEEIALTRTFEAFDISVTHDAHALYREINAEAWAAFEAGELTQDVLRVQRFQKLLESLDLSHDPAAFSARYLNYLGQQTHLIDGAASVLQTLADHVHLALITNGLADTQRSRLARTPITPYFEAIVISEEVGVAKPDPHIFDVAFKKMQDPEKSEVLIVGDSLSSDMQGGIDYGIDTCWFNPGHRPRVPALDVTYEIDRLAALVTLLGL